jgi:hypothetical protein
MHGVRLPDYPHSGTGGMGALPRVSQLGHDGDMVPREGEPPATRHRKLQQPSFLNGFSLEIGAPY